MSKELTSEQVRASIVPKADQLNADDLIAGPVTVTIVGARSGDKDCPIFIDLEGYEKRPFKPCKTMRRILVAVFGDEPKPWIGQKMTLFRDPQVQYMGETVGGIRISHLSGLTEPEKLSVTEKRGRRIEWVVCPIPLPPAEQKYVADAKRQIAEAANMEVLKALGQAIAQQVPTVQSCLRRPYKQRKKELEAKTETDTRV